MGKVGALDSDEDEDLNTVDSSYMLNLKVPSSDSSTDATPRRKFNKINSPKYKSKSQQQKKRTNTK